MKIDEIFKAISGKIEADVAAVRWVDFDLGQFEVDPPPVSWPATLIGFTDADFSQIGGDGQLAECIVTIRVGFREYERTHSKAPTNYRDVGLSHFATLDAIHQAINGLSGTSFRDLTRMAVNQEQRADYRVYVMTYSYLYCDIPDSGYTDWDTASGGADLDVCIDADIE